LKSVELFAGAGGLALGVSQAGFVPLAVIEWDKWACATIRQNQRRNFPMLADVPLWEGDIRNFDWDCLEENIDLVTGGPPCQPFSTAGNHKAYRDSRDMFPAMIDVIRKLKPKSFIIENVKGLTRTNFTNYYQYILLQLEYPDIVAKNNDSWFEHFKKLQIQKTTEVASSYGLKYRVIPTLVNAADYGIPQKRERVFIVGFRSDIDARWYFPKPTHSLNSLLYSKWISGEYWEEHKIIQPIRPEKIKKSIEIIKKNNDFFSLKPWRTVRDAFKGLPSPLIEKETNFYHNHFFQDGARIYKGHTGSPLDEPAKTIKAGNHGVPGGENMVVLEKGNVRYFSIRECARLQTFPDGYTFDGSWSEAIRQLGNAVPVALARKVASSVAIALADYQIRALSRKNGNKRYG